jgi:hypothetical protein
MKTISIVESDMTFGPYPEDNCFQIEKSQIYEEIQQNVKIAEFILLRSQKLWIVEAKSSTPRPETQPNFDIFIEEVGEKLSNALSLVLALCLERHPNEKLPQAFQQINLAKVEFRLILVVNKHEEAWLPPLQDALQESLKTTLKIWGSSVVIVMNDQLAQEYQLISPE